MLYVAGCPSCCHGGVGGSGGGVFYCESFIVHHVESAASSMLTSHVPFKCPLCFGDKKNSGKE